MFRKNYLVLADVTLPKNKKLMSESKSNELTEKKHRKKIKEPKKLFHTYLRNQNKLYVNIFNMIDRKSAMMIKVNATAFSVAVFFYKHISKFEYGKAIAVTIVVSSFLSLMFALKASRPFREFVFGRKNKKLKLEENIFALGTIKEPTLQAYEKAYEELMKSQELQVGNQVRAMYDFENYIRKSFQQLELSYLSFFVGFGIIALMFVIARF